MSAATVVPQRPSGEQVFGSHANGVVVDHLTEWVVDGVHLKVRIVSGLKMMLTFHLSFNSSFQFYQNKVCEATF